jgi:hypothetical protein
MTPRAAPVTTDATDTLAAQRFRAMVAQLRLSRARAAALLRAIADELDEAGADEHVRAAAEIEAERLRAQGFSVGPGPRFEIKTPAAAVLLGRSSGTLKNWRSDGTGPAWRGDGAGRVMYSLVDVVAWSRMVTVSGADDV